MAHQWALLSRVVDSYVACPVLTSLFAGGVRVEATGCLWVAELTFSGGAGSSKVGGLTGPWLGRKQDSWACQHNKYICQPHRGLSCCFLTLGGHILCPYWTLLVDTQRYLQKCWVQCILTLVFVPLKPHSLHCCRVTSSPTIMSWIAISVAEATHHSCPTFFGLGCGVSSGTLINWTVQSPMDCSFIGRIASLSAGWSPRPPVQAPADNPPLSLVEWRHQLSGPIEPDGTA